MTTSGVFNLNAVTAVTGNRATINGETFGSTGLGTLTVASASADNAYFKAVGDIHGFLRFPFADPVTLQGQLTPQDLSTAQIKLTQGGAGAALALIVEEIYKY